MYLFYILIREGIMAGVALALASGIEIGNGPFTFLTICCGFSVLNTLLIKLNRVLKESEAPLSVLLWWVANLVLFLLFLRFIPNFHVSNPIWMLFFAAIYRILKRLVFLGK